MTHVLNESVNVTAYSFTKGRTFPRRIQYGNTELVFDQIGLRCLVKRGQELIEIFNMTDGRDQYRLKFEPAVRSWTLLTKRALV